MCLLNQLQTGVYQVHGFYIIQTVRGASRCLKTGMDACGYGVKFVGNAYLRYRPYQNITKGDLRFAQQKIEENITLNDWRTWISRLSNYCRN